MGEAFNVRSAIVIKLTKVSYVTLRPFPRLHHVWTLC